MFICAISDIFRWLQQASDMITE